MAWLRCSNLIFFLAGTIDENYYLSLVEQEIAQQATFFLGTELSTWSEFILHVLFSSAPRLFLHS
jgi:hypothetical protein